MPRLSPSFALLLLVGAALSACDDDAGATPEGDAAMADAAVTPDEGPGDAAPTDAAPDAAAPACDGTAHRYDPLHATELLQWPDGVWSVADAAHAGGHRLNLNTENAPWIAAVTPLVRSAVDDLNRVGGYGRNAASFFRFSAPVAMEVTGETPYAGDDLLWVDLDVDPPKPVPFGVTAVEAGATVILSPLVPLVSGHRHLVGVRASLTDAEGGCVAQAPVMAALLAGEAPEPAFEPLVAELAAAQAALELAPGALLAATVFRAQSDHLPIVAAAEHAHGLSPRWDAPATCEDHTGWRQCEATFTATDYRDDRAIFTGTPQAQWTLRATIWLPKDATGPVPTIVYGHGIGSTRFGAGEVVDVVLPAGYAVVAIDALHHGDHPTAEGDASSAAFKFLGLDAANLKLDGLALRGNFNQTVLDRLQLVNLIRQAPDVDGDGSPDLDADTIGYWGISLGSMLSPGLLALEPSIEAAVLSVGGGKLMAFVTDTAQIAALRPLLRNLAGGADNLERLLPVIQTVVDVADPASWATFVNRDRFDGGTGPHVLLPVAAEDGTVPPVSGRALARAFGLPQVLPAVTEVSLLSTVPAPFAPAEGPVRAYFQFDRISNGARISAASHGNTPTGTEGALQALTFLNGWLDGQPLVIDPYAELGTAPLP